MVKILSKTLGIAALCLPLWMNAAEQGAAAKDDDTELLSAKYNCKMTTMDGKDYQTLFDNALGWHNSLWGNKNLNGTEESGFAQAGFADIKWSRKVEITKIEFYVLDGLDTVFKGMVLPNSIKLIIPNEKGDLEKVVAKKDETIRKKSWNPVSKWNGKEENALCYTLSDLSIKTSELRLMWGSGGGAWTVIGDVKIYGYPTD